ncbi:Nonribosomal peptide synthetases (NRPS) [Aspergillus tanneri]|uniref:Nonribosomal peptide synthetases (NRPS) n=1 Tax=Aspergillus tanneri TaxID=1220188 RepID=A0A5M9MF89_9EURO|nr:Nonribosomal peptide synthetases (NRPS) [Aspergillus tanneri]KAA8643964.1 Nonribosomal peptide synthetases (NRPS) [Aspergillus tanneri]
MSFQNLQYLLEAVAAHENNGNIISYSPGNMAQPKSCSYRRLLEVARNACRALRSAETFQPGSVVLLHFSSHWDNIVWFWAVLFAGCVPAMSTALSNSSSLRMSHLGHLSRTLMNPLCLTSGALLPEFGGQDSIQPIAVESLDPAKALRTELGDIYRESGPTDSAVLMLTSGSTGNCKAVSLTHGQILFAIAGKLSVVILPEEGSFLNWIGLDHVAGLIEIHLQAMYARKDQIHAPTRDILSNPAEFLHLIDRHRVSRTFAPNFFLARIRAVLQDKSNTANEHSWDLCSLRFIASGGEANVTKTCVDVSDLLEQYGAAKNVIVPGFGMTETCAGAIFNTHCPQYDVEKSLEFTSVGLCMPGIRMRITDGSGGLILPPGMIGNLEVTGPVVCQKYFNDPTATANSFTSDGWFKTGDRGMTDETGFLTLMGRAKETMIVNGIKYNPQEIESALDESKIPGTTPSFNCCFSSFRPEGETEVVCLAYLPTYAPEDIVSRVQTADAIAKVVMITTGSRPEILPLDKTRLQKSALGKLSRAKIKQAYEQGDYQEYQRVNSEQIKSHRAATGASPKDELEQKMLTIFVHSLGVTELGFDVETPVFDMGITSIELIKLKKDLEDHLQLTREIPMVALMSNSTVRELANALRELQAPHHYNPVVTLQSQGNKTPLWLIHPGVGEVLVFLNLAKFMVDRPVYALRARGFNEGEDPFGTIPEVVTTYHAAIKMRQPKGPYALAGYSYGSMLAFEVGKVLEQKGDEVRFLGSFNLPPHIKTRMRQLDWKECLLHLSYFLDLMTEEHARELAAELEGATRDETLAKVMEDANQDRLAELAISQSALAKWAGLAFALQSMAVDYDPTGSIAGIDIFYCTPLAVVAASKEQWRDEHLSKWDHFTRTEPRFHEVGGAHYTMLGPEHVLRFQKTLRGALSARGL